ncbi:MAG TPA: WYL domain-containing protein [Acidimicrobiales bacterium]|nr:WYL domain-containing protein [Acidimicrobiales bacterium]
MPTSDRLLRLLSLLQQRAHWSGPELAERLGITTRTVRRDVDRLRELGYRVDAGPGPQGGGYRLGTGAALPPLLLDDDEATAIAIALGASAAGAVQGIEEPALAALAKLDRLLPAHLRTRVDAIRRATLPIGDAEPVRSDILLTVARAATDQERLAVTYVDRGGRRTERRIDPFRLVSTGRRWYLVAFDVDRDDWRTLRVDRIGEATGTGHRFRLDDPPDATAFVSRASGVGPYPVVARVVLHAPPDVVSARVPPTVGLVEAHPDGSLLTVGGYDVASLAGHLVAVDLPFVALDPPELRDHLRQLGRRLTATAATP